MWSVTKQSKISFCAVLLVPLSPDYFSMPFFLKWEGKCTIGQLYCTNKTVWLTIFIFDECKDTCWVHYLFMYRILERHKAVASGKIHKSVDLVSEFVDELANLREALRDVGQCLHCRIAISRVSGCNYTRCRSCGNRFCYNDCGTPHNVLYTLLGLG
jgi:hypothetical protein